jgi:hypothetical protein
VDLLGYVRSYRRRRMGRKNRDGVRGLGGGSPIAKGFRDISYDIFLYILYFLRFRLF